MAFTGETLAGGLRALAEQVEEGMIISTCNRTEVYVVADSPELGRERVLTFLSRYHGMPAGALDGMSYSHAGDGAIRHLFRVASGLDSIVLGEPQILTQIRDSLDAARSAESVGPYLQRLATDALKVGKRARTDTDIARNNLSISHAAVDLAVLELPDLADRRVAVLGAGKMASIAARVLASRGVGQLTIVNRSLDRTTDLAAQVGADVRPIDELGAVIAESDAVIAAVLVDRPLVTPDLIAPRSSPLLLIDLGVPRIVDVACGQLEHVRVMDVDHLEAVSHETRQLYAQEMRKVEGLVDGATGDYESWVESRQAATAIAALRRRSDDVRERELERALRRLQHLPERDQNVVRALAKGLTNTLLHEPVQSLRGASSTEEIQHILEAFGIDEEDADRS